MRTLAALLLLALVCGARAQSADDYLHGASAKYIQGRNQEASIQVEEGLRRYPADAKLKALADHLKRLKDQKKQDGASQSGSQGDQGDKQEGKQDESRDGGGKDGENQDQPKPDPDEKDGQGEDGKEQEGAEADKQDGKDSTGQAMAPAKPGEMSKEDAERLLNSIQDDEKKEHRQQQKRYRKRPEVEQDW